MKQKEDMEMELYWDEEMGERVRVEERVPMYLVFFALAVANVAFWIGVAIGLWIS